MKKNSMPGIYEGFGEHLYPRYVKHSLYVSGYDGIKLAVDVVRPADVQGQVVEKPLPVLLLLSRGGRYDNPDDPTGNNIITHCIPYGYVGVVAEMRGCGASYGTNDSFCSIENRQDVTSILEWLETQSFCDGKVGTFGGSNRGLIQLAAAVAKPAPGKILKAITPVVANADFYYQDYPNGTSAIPHRKVMKALSGSRTDAIKRSKEEFLKTVSVVDEDIDGSMAYEAYLTGQYGKNHPFMGWLLLNDMCRDDENPNLDEERTNLTIPPVTDLEIFKNADIKIHQFAGFIESGAFGQLMAAKEWGGSILIGPWNHWESRRGTKAFPEGEFDFLAEHHKWFDATLKGIDNGFLEQPPFIYYTQNAKAGEYWRCSDTWPLETVRPMTLYLSPALSGTCASVWDGTLSQRKPEEQTRTQYKVDTGIRVFDDGEGATMDRMNLAWSGDMTEGVDCHALTFTSAPLFKRYEAELTGETSVSLWVTCTHKDVDFIVYLEEVLSDGTSHYISFGCQRASHRTAEERISWNECGATYHPCMRKDMERCLEEGMEEPVLLDFHIEPVSYVFQSGSRIRITVTCANEQCFCHSIYEENNLPVISLFQGGDLSSFVRIPFIEHIENVYNGAVTFGEYKGPGTLYYFKNNTYLYCDGCWKRYRSDSDDMSYVIKEGTAHFRAGFTFCQEGYPIQDGILQHYQGDASVKGLFPSHRNVLISKESVDARDDILFVPDKKSLYMEVFGARNINGKAPCIVYIHGYSATPSMLCPEILDFVENDYTIASIDLRPYPPNCFPDYIYDIKAAVRYLRVHAEELGIDPNRIGSYGRSLGGNAALMLAVSGGNEELEGEVGGNLSVSSRIQAAVIGYGWSDILHMGEDLLEEYQEATEAVKELKFRNSDGPFAPLAQVIDFTGKGKGMKVLREYAEHGKEGSTKEFDEALIRARAASPVNHIGPDSPPLALFSGIGMSKVDIPDRQSHRTFNQCGKYGVDCFLFSNTNGEYGKKPEIRAAIQYFFDRHLRHAPAIKKTVAAPNALKIVEDYKDRILEYAVIVRKEDELLFAAPYVEERFGIPISAKTVTINGTQYVTEEVFQASPYSYSYYEDKNVVVLGEKEVLPSQEIKDREI